MVEAPGDATLSDEELLERIADHNSAAFTMLKRRHGEKVRGLALSFSGASRTRTTSPRTCSSCRGGNLASRCSRLLYRVVANRCLDQARRGRFRYLPFAAFRSPR